MTRWTLLREFLQTAATRMGDWRGKSAGPDAAVPLRGALFSTGQMACAPRPARAATRTTLTWR